MSFETSAVPIQHYTGEEQLLSDITILRKPTVIRGCPLGPCSSWTPEHLAERLSGTSRPVHVTTETNMDFIAKNFRYATMDIGKVPSNDLMMLTKVCLTGDIISCSHLFR